MPDLGELTRQYQAALEEYRTREARCEDTETIAAELDQAEAAMNAAWLERTCA